MQRERIQRFPLFDTTPSAPGAGGGGGSITPSTTSSSPSSSSSAPSAAPGGSPSSGSAPAVSPAPATPGVVAPQTAPGAGDGAGDTSFDFGAIFDAPTETPVAPPPAQPAVPATPAATAPVVAPAQPEPAAPVAPVAQSGTGPQGAPNPAEPQTIADALVTHEAEAVEHVAQHLFALTPEDLGALETDAAGLLSKLMARVYVKANQQMMRHLARSVPLMVTKHTEATRASESNRAGFYSAWPSLDQTKHGAMVNQVAQAYRAANPSVSKDDMIKAVGAIVHHMAGVAMPVAGSPPTQPKSPMAANGARAPQPSPFQPAASVAPAAMTTAEGDPWGFLSPEAGE